jgi:16S rRNA (guanine966-N2)-methyltransferase
MRIIAGQHRGHRLIPPPGETTRPITDRAKQSLFDALQNCFVNAAVLDCFAGTGSLGLECLSRGAARAIFIERDRPALKALRQNLADLHLEASATILPIDAYALASLSPQSSVLSTLTPLTIAFIDPPYSHTETGHRRHKIDELLRTLAANAMVDGGILSFRHPGSVTVDAAALGVRIVREFRYGDMAITWLTRE